MANKKHLKLLRQGVDAWNAWRAREPSSRPDLSGAELRRANLVRANLAQANLSEANLNEANLNEANLNEVNLSGATLNRAKLIRANLVRANLSGANLARANLWRANLSGSNLSKAKLSGADFREADLVTANLDRANLRDAAFRGADLSEANLNAANLRGAKLVGADLRHADLSEAILRVADLSGADLHEADLKGADLGEAILREANLWRANLSRADLVEADLHGANLGRANLSRADLSEAILSEAALVRTNLADAVLTGCSIYGVSAWNLKLSEGTKQQDLVITPPDEPPVTVDDLKVAQFVLLLLRNKKIRKVIDTVGRKGVLLVGRFTDSRIEVLERLREALRQRGYVPIVFNFNKPETKDFTETVRILAGLSKFVIADITNPKSAPLELQATMPEITVPFQPIIEDGQTAFAMLEDMQRKYDWVFPTLRYSWLDRLIETLDDEIVGPAEAKFSQLLLRRAEPIEDRHL
jgi:uncharacterized protein YjbI with pentapeptide repeats